MVYRLFSLLLYIFLYNLIKKRCRFMANYNRFYKELGKFIKELRIKKGLYQKELAGKMNISDMTISRWELGATRPSDKKLRMLCEILDIDFDEFIYQINERTAQSKENDIHNFLTLYIFSYENIQ